MQGLAPHAEHKTTNGKYDHGRKQRKNRHKNPQRGHKQQHKQRERAHEHQCAHV